MFTNEQMEQLRLLLSNLATKGDLGLLKDDMKFMENSLVTKINKVTTMLEGDFFNESKRVNTLTHRVSDLNKRVEHLEQK